MLEASLGYIAGFLSQIKSQINKQICHSVCDCITLFLSSPLCSGFEWCTGLGHQTPMASLAIRTFQLHDCVRRSLAGCYWWYCHMYRVIHHMWGYLRIGNSASAACGEKLLTWAHAVYGWSVPALGQRHERVFHPYRAKSMPGLEVLTDRADECLGPMWQATRWILWALARWEPQSLPVY